MGETPYQARTQRLQEKLQAAGLDAMILSSTGDIYYFGGFWGYMGAFRKVYMVVPVDATPTMLTSRLEEAYKERPILGMQFHPERYTERRPAGRALLLNGHRFLLSQRLPRLAVDELINVTD